MAPDRQMDKNYIPSLGAKGALPTQLAANKIRIFVETAEPKRYKSFVYVGNC
jgi:hypothetical protein